MSITITIDGVDRTSLIDRRTFKITKQLTSQVDSCNFQYRKYGARTWEPEENKEIIVTKDGTKVFAGYIINVTAKNYNKTIVFSAQAKDYSYLLDRRLVVESYAGMTPKAIVDDIISKYVASGVTDTYVETTPTVSQITFNYISVTKALQALADLCQKNWWIDENKVIHMTDKVSVPSPNAVTDTNGNLIFNTLSVKTDISNLKNRIEVLGGEYDGSTQVEKFTGQTSKDIFILGYKPRISAMVVVAGANTYSGSQIGIDGVSDPSAVSVLVNQTNHTIIFTSGHVPAGGDVITVTYTPILPVIVALSDPASIVIYGTHESQINNNSISSIQEARDRANAELSAYANPVLNGQFQSYTDGFDVGQLVSINSTDGELNDDYLINKLDIIFQTNAEFLYTVYFTNTKQFGVMEFLQRILLLTGTPDSNLLNEVIEKVEGIAEEIDIMEALQYQIDGDASPRERIEGAESIVAEIDNPRTWVAGQYNPTNQADRNRPPLADGHALLRA